MGHRPFILQPECFICQSVERESLRTYNWKSEYLLLTLTESQAYRWLPSSLSWHLKSSRFQGGSQILKIYILESAWQHNLCEMMGEKITITFSECHGSKERCDSGIDCSSDVEGDINSLTCLSVHKRAKVSPIWK